MLARPTTKPTKADYRGPDMDAEFAVLTAKLDPWDRVWCQTARIAAMLWLYRIVLNQNSGAHSPPP